ncbi:hypothetical protein Nmel_003537 [Mimus melanotis]
MPFPDKRFQEILTWQIHHKYCPRKRQ